MEILTVHDGRKLTILLQGKLDTLTAPQLTSALDVALKDVDTLIFDMKDLEYVSSAGLRVLLVAQKRMGEGNMKLRNVNAVVHEVLDITGFSDILDIE